MKNIALILWMLMILGAIGCQAQKNENMLDKKNPLLCDPQSGICELPESRGAEAPHEMPAHAQKPVKIIYFTDPICSSCWGIEPQLRKLKLEYGHSVEIEYRMGGLLPDWSYNSGGISKPSDVAPHWDEVSHYYNMPIDGDIWLEDPLDSSYPPSIAFKAAQMQDQYKAVAFLRALRELLFLQKKNITRWEYVAQAAEKTGLDTALLHMDMEGKAKDQFEEDLQLARRMGVRGFPTLFFTDDDGHTALLYGFKPYAQFEENIRKIDPDAVKTTYPKGWQDLFATYPTLTLREYAELAEVSLPDAQRLLDEQAARGALSVISCKNGNLWKVLTE